MHTKRMLSLLMAMVFCLTSQIFSQAQMEVSPPTSVDVGPPPGQTIVIPINLTNPNNTSIDAFGLHFVYPTGVLSFQNVDKTGTLTDNWDTVGGQENTPGEIVIGALIGQVGTPTNAASGVLLNVEFTVTDPGVGSLQFTDFVDDIANANTTNGTLNSTVPVELASFSAEVSEQSVKLFWITVSESNNYGFHVEKSRDTESFTKIGFVPGHGTTTSPQRYTFEDNNVVTGTYYYRLKQVDTDGSFSYSSPLQVEMVAPETFSLQQNYPNPFNPETIIRYQLPEAAFVNLVVYNLKGQAIRNLVNEKISAGFHNSIWNGRDDLGHEVASGVYIYRIKAGNFTEIRKLTLMR